MDEEVWTCLQTAFGELSPCPFVVFVGHFQQLQPIRGVHALRQDLNRVQAQAAGGLQQVELQQHAAARSTDPNMLAFLAHARIHQPSRNCLETFFAGRCFSRDLDTTVQQVLRLERQTGRAFTFLTTQHNRSPLGAHDACKEIPMLKVKPWFCSLACEFD